MVGHLLENFAIDQEIGINEHIERVGDHTFCRVLDRNHTKIGSPPLDFTEYVLDTIDRNILGGRPEFLGAGHMRKRSSGTEIGHLLRALEREGGGHDFPIDWPNRLGWKWPGVLLYEALDYRRLPRLGMEIGTRILLFLELADLDDAFRPFIQQAQNFVVNAIDLFPVLGKGSGHSLPSLSSPGKLSPVHRLEWHKLSGK